MKSVGDIVVYTLGWLQDQPISAGENPNSMLHCRIVVDGVEIKCAHAIKVEAKGGDFTKATLSLNVSELIFVALTDAQFRLDELPGEP